MQIPAFANAINSNQNDASNENNETGFSVVKNNDNIEIAQISSSNHNCNVLDFTPSVNWIGFIHCHPDGCDNITRMFSGEDILKLVELVGNYGNGAATTSAHQEFFAILSSSLGTYAIKIKIFSQFNYFISQNKLYTKKCRVAFTKNFYNAYNAIPTLFNSQQKDNATSLLNVIEEYQMGLGLYKLNDNEIWEEMEVENSHAASKPCN